MIAAVILGLVFLGIWILLSWQPGTKNKRLDALPEFLRTLNSGMENGSELEILHKGTDTSFKFCRVSGEQAQAEIELVLPKTEWSKKYETMLSQAFANHGFQYFESPKCSTTLGKVVISVSDIWDYASGASCAHAARILVDTISLPRNARYDVRFVGRTSTRILGARKHS